MTHAPPGRLVDLGGRRLHLHLTANATANAPVVILEAGLAATCLSWALVQPAIAEFATVGSYDRAGLGYSDLPPANTPATALNAVRDLHELLRRADLRGPFILVGHSFGGLIVRLFQQLHPEQVTGLVLVDPVVRAQWRDPDPRHAHMLAHGASLSRRGAVLARLGIVRYALKKLTAPGPHKVPGLLAKLFAGHASGVANRLVGEVRKIPRELWPAIAAHWSEERSFRIMAEYLDSLPVSCGQLDETRSLGDLPLAVLSSGSASEDTLAEHRHEASLSTCAEHIAVPDSGHWINLDAPEAIADAVRRIIHKCPKT